MTIIYVFFSFGQSKPNIIKQHLAFCKIENTNTHTCMHIAHILANIVRDRKSGNSKNSYHTLDGKSDSNYLLIYKLLQIPRLDLCSRKQWH